MRNARVAELVAGRPGRMPLAGDQLHADLDLSLGNLPAGSLPAIGPAVLRVGAAPHLGCAKFAGRFGAEAMRLVNSRDGRRMRLRGMNTRVAVPGTVRLGDLAAKVPRCSDRQAATGMTRGSVPPAGHDNDPTQRNELTSQH